MMRHCFRRLSATLLVAVIGVPLPAADAWWQRWSAPQPGTAPKWTNSMRIEKLLRAGKIYITLEDAIALAIENNLDVEFQRQNFAIAKAEIQRTAGGGTTRGLNYTLAEAPAGIGGPAGSLQTSSAAQRALPGAAISTNPLETGALGQIQSNLNLLGPVPLNAGTPIPLLDPVASVRSSFLHQSIPQVSIAQTGVPNLVTETVAAGAAYRQGFGPGTAFTAVFDNTRQTTSSLRSNYDPYVTSAFSVSLTQPLLRGFGAKVNRRYQRMAENQERIADLLFRQQLINTVYGVTRLYSDFVALGEDIKVKEESYKMAQKLLADTTAHVEEGTLAAVELARAKAQVFSTRLDLEKAQGQYEEQQAILKNVLTRRGGADPLVRDAPLVPLTTLAAEGAADRKLDELFEEAVSKRPDLAQADLQISNLGLSLEGTRSAVKPQLDLVASAQNSGLAGQLNPTVVSPSPVFAGGYGTALSQVLKRNYPTYAAGIQLDLPWHNRVAQADLARDEAMLRQIEIRVQQMRNQARLEVEDAMIAVGRAWAAYEAARQALEFQQESLAAETAKFEVGASTSLLLVQVQNSVAQARSSEVAARAALVKAHAALDRATGTTLEKNHISVDAARQGSM